MKKVKKVSSYVIGVLFLSALTIVNINVGLNNDSEILSRFSLIETVEAQSEEEGLECDDLLECEDSDDGCEGPGLISSCEITCPENPENTVVCGTVSDPMVPGID